jgi:hypothetical protein
MKSNGLYQRLLVQSMRRRTWARPHLAREQHGARVFVNAHPPRAPAYLGTSRFNKPKGVWAHPHPIHQSRSARVFVSTHPPRSCPRTHETFMTPSNTRSGMFLPNANANQRIGEAPMLSGYVSCRVLWCCWLGAVVRRPLKFLSRRGGIQDTSQAARYHEFSFD